jgi:hypothetical protein
MKKIKIRYVEHQKGCFAIQKRAGFWWRYITFEISGNGGSVIFRYSQPSKKKVLKKVLDKHYKVSKKCVTIIEHPMLRIY